jgi:FAD/FMN-containing dehydrogenase
VTAIDRVLAEQDKFPDDFFSRDPDDLVEYGKDWTKVYAPAPSVIAFPRTTADVSRLLALCHQHCASVVPSGGRTGLAGGAVAKDGEVVLSLCRMRRIDPVDVLGATVRVQAGVITQAVHAHCAPLGLSWPIDFASKGSSQVGGNIATNAGGVKVIRYGLTRQWVLGLQVVLADGRVLELGGGLEKNNTGVDLRQLFIGSEGILGVITEATLKLTRLPPKLDVLLFGVRSLEGVLHLFGEARRGPFTISAFEFFTDKCLLRLLMHRALRPPLEASAPFYVLLEIEGGAAQDVEPWLASLFDRDLVIDGTLAQHTEQAAALWALREGISESLAATGLPHKNDIALPVAALEGFCAAFGQVFETRYPGWEVCLFGHIGDGNLHVNIMKPDALSREEFWAQTKAADDDMFALVRDFGGSISAEHGVGLLKKSHLGYSRSPDEIALMRALKRVFDPRNILNPGKVFDVLEEAK